MLNLVTNACDAMPNPGEVTITVRPVPGDEARQLGSRLVESQQALLEVADTGTGVVPELRTRIFEPFFTTKQRGKGTGLGLAAVQGIVVQNKGSLALDSELGKGSRFRIFFAVAAAAEEPALASDQAPASPGDKKAKGRILIVDDEDGVRFTAKRLLENHGYGVLVASSGAEALQLLASNPPVDLVLADLAMPEMDGRELGERVLHHYPGLPVMYMSGYFNDPSLSQPGAQRVTGYLAKPFSREQLFDAVHSAMHPEEARL